MQHQAGANVEIKRHDMNRTLLAALLLTACADPGGGRVGLVGDVWIDTGAEDAAVDLAEVGVADGVKFDNPAPDGLWDWNGVEPPGECMEAHAEGVVEWEVRPEDMPGAEPWRCAPSWVAACVAVTRGDGCYQYDCWDSQAECWRTVDVWGCEAEHRPPGWWTCGCPAMAVLECLG
jgi:hypothetical protein